MSREEEKEKLKTIVTEENEDCYGNDGTEVDKSGIRRSKIKNTLTVIDRCSK